MTIDKPFSKAAIRQRVRSDRQQIASDEHKHYGKELARRLAAERWFQTANHIAAYLANDGELNVTPIIEQCWQSHQQIYLPVCRPLPPNRLWFIPFTSTDTLCPNRFGIPEPTSSIHKAIAPSALDIVLFPLVAFDMQFNRLGMGGGFYDRTFAHLSTTASRPKFVGIALDQQEVDYVPNEKWDIPLDWIATPTRILQNAQSIVKT